MGFEFQARCGYYSGEDDACYEVNQIHAHRGGGHDEEACHQVAPADGVEAYFPEKCDDKRQNRDDDGCREIEAEHRKQLYFVEKPQCGVEKQHHDEQWPEAVFAILHLERLNEFPAFHHGDEEGWYEASH